MSRKSEGCSPRTMARVRVGLRRARLGVRPTCPRSRPMLRANTSMEVASPLSSIFRHWWARARALISVRSGCVVLPAGSIRVAAPRRKRARTGSDRMKSSLSSTSVSPLSRSSCRSPRICASVHVRASGRADRQTAIASARFRWIGPSSAEPTGSFVDHAVL